MNNNNKKNISQKVSIITLYDSIFWMKIIYCVGINIQSSIFKFLNTRGPCPLRVLLVNPHLQALQPMFAKSHLILANIKQILIHFVYMRDQEKQ